MARFVSTEYVHKRQMDPSAVTARRLLTTHSTLAARRPLLLLGSLIPRLDSSRSLLENTAAGTMRAAEPSLLTVTHKAGRMCRSEVDFGRQQSGKLGHDFSLIQIKGKLATDVSGTKTSLHVSDCNPRTRILQVLEPR